VLLSCLVAMTPAEAATGHGAAAGTERAHRLPGLVHPRPVPQRASGHERLLGASRAVPGKPAARPGPHYSAVARADIAAAVQARRTGQAVVVPSQTTQTMEVLAHPDGTFEMISNALPARVQVHSRWVPISTALRRNPDGTWSAPLTSAPVTFSGGGSGPLVRVTDPASGRWVSVSWPYRLPRPVVTGAVALYRDVLPGVDLRLQATSTGYQEVVIIHDAAAAANPRLRSLTFTLAGGPGVAIRRGRDGATVAADSATGQVLFTSGQPMMWDSRRNPHRAVPSAGSAGLSAVAMVPEHPATAGRSAMALTLSPPAVALTGRRVEFPVYLDPEISDSGTQYYSEVASFGGVWNTTTGTTSVGSGAVEVGYCGYSDCEYEWDGRVYQGYVNRVYFRMDTAPLEERNGYHPDVYSATFYADEVGNSDGCTAQDVALYSAGAISSSTTWGGPQESSISEAASAAGGDASCSERAADVDLSATSYVQGAENDSDPNLTFELRAPSESDELQYKVFTDNPSLDVYYNFAPLTPAGLSASDAVTCTSTTYTSASEPTLSATGTDNNPSPLNLDYHFTLDTSSGSAVSSDTLSNGGGGYASGHAVGWDSEGTLTSGDAYEFDVYTTNVLASGDQSGARSSPTSSMYDFTDLSSPPAAAPVISSFDYPSGQWGQPAGAPGVFTVGTNGDPGIAGFAYSFDGGPGSEPVPSTTNCGYLSDGGLGTSADASGGGNSGGELALVEGSSAQIQVPSGLAPGQHTLYVRSFDYAHNASPEVAYTFYVAPDFQSTSQPVTYTDASSLASSATGANASLVAAQAGTCCSITTWRGGDQLLFSATAAGDTFTIPLTVPDAGTWQLGADMTTGPAYGEAEVDLDQSGSDTALGGTAATGFDGYSRVVSNSYLDLGTQYLTAGTHTLTFTVVGQDASSTGFEIGINYLTLSPTSRYEADSLSWSGTNTAGTLAAQCLDEPAWSDNCQLFLQNTAQGTSFAVTFDAPVESDYALGVNLTTADDYGEIRFDLDPSAGDINLDDTASDPIDAYSSHLSSEYVFLGGVHLTAGTHVLKVTVVGTDSSSVNNRYNAGINYLEAVPVTGATDASLTSAMNNQGIVSDGASLTGRTGNFDLTSDAAGGNLSLQALEDAGITPGTATGPGGTFSLNGATFTMPQLSANPAGAVVADNVIPDGQTIPLPSADATGVALLVAATCGATPQATAQLNYGGGGQPSNAAIPSVPDWLAGAPSGAVMELGYYDAGSAQDSSGQPRLYEVMLPANPNYPLASITLPVMTANFLTNTGSCALSNVLHVLAIGTRTVAAGPSGTVWTGAYEAPMDTASVPGSGLSNQTLREAVPLSSDGSGYLRVHLSNAHSNTPVTFDPVTVAAQASAGSPATLAAPVDVTFGSSGSNSVTLPAGADAWSNPVAMPSMSSGTGWLTVSMYIPSGDAGALGSIHDSANLTTYYATGNDAADSAGTDDFDSTDSLTGQFYLSGVDVSQGTTTDGTIAVLGDQTATQAPAWTYGNWTSGLPSALSAQGVTVPGSIVDASTDDAQPSDWWRMNGSPLDTATTAYDSGSVGTSSLTLEGGPGWSADNPGTGTSAGSLSLNGTSQDAQSSGPVIDGTSSFAVSAWVRLSSLVTRNAAVAAQDGTTDSGFYLGYNYVNGGVWSFYFANSDTTSPSFTGVYGPAAVAGVWTLLTGVYNADLGQIQLYVNGTLATSTSFTPAWSATGPFTVGRDRYNGAPGDFFPGEITDVRAYNDPVWQDNVDEIYNDLGTSSITTADAPAAFENYAAVEPNLRDVIVSLGANDVLEGEPAATIESNLRGLISDIEGRYVNDEPDTAVRAFVTTIPPLGLASGDPREAVREAVNSWLLGSNTTAAAVFDIASAVANPSSPNDVDPAYLTSGVPNSSYDQAIASAVASGIADVIPPVTLSPS
jgi:OSK domain